MVAAHSPKAVVLLSGGVDSALLIALLHKRNWNLEALWVDYGQPARDSEEVASAAVAAHYGVPWSSTEAPSWGTYPGEIPHRNDVLMALAAALFPKQCIALGIHSGTPYADCSPPWVEAWNRLLAVQEPSHSGLQTPLLHLEKGEVYALANLEDVPTSLTYSCETGNSPCGTCRSCHDRKDSRCNSLDPG